MVEGMVRYRMNGCAETDPQKIDIHRVLGQRLRQRVGAGLLTGEVCDGGRGANRV